MLIHLILLISSINSINTTVTQVFSLLALVGQADIASFPLAQWVATVCHEVQADLDLDELGKLLAMGGELGNSSFLVSSLGRDRDRDRATIR